MAKTAKLFMNGRSQAVRLPKEFRFEGEAVEIERDPVTGGVLLREQKQTTARSFLDLLEELDPSDIPHGFPWRDARLPEREDPTG